MILNLGSQWKDFYGILFHFILEVAFNSRRIISVLFLASQTSIAQKTYFKTQLFIF